MKRKAKSLLCGGGCDEGGGDGGSLGGMPPLFRVGTEALTFRVLSLVPFGEA